MKVYYKVLIGVFSLFILLILLNVGLNFWVKDHLPKIINKENDSAYTISYKSIDVSILDRNIMVTNIVIVPKSKDSITSEKIGIYAKIKSVQVKDFKTWDIIFNHQIKAKSVAIETPEIILYQKDKKATLKESVVAPFNKIISVSDIYLKHGDLKIIENKTNKPILSVQNINSQLEGILITEKILAEKIPFAFKNYTLKCDSIYFQPNEFYTIKAKQVSTTKSDFKANNIEMIPTYSRRKFVSKIQTEKDLYTVICKTISASNIDWGFKKDDFFFHCNEVDLNQISANIYRSKVPADDLTKKHLYNKLLRDLKFDLKVNTLKIRNSLLEYEEEKSFEYGAGKIHFNKFNLIATSIQSGFKKQKLDDIQIKINSIFMNESPFNVDWKLNVLDKNDGFTIKGTLTNFDAKNIVPFTKPYINATTEGVIDELYFDFKGNDVKSTGKFAVKYDDLKFTVYKKDNRKKKNKLLTFVANIFVKNETKEKLKDVEVEVNRVPEKSFYNFLWINIAEGLKKVLI